MKKPVLILATAALMIISCKDAKQDEMENDMEQVSNDAENTMDKKMNYSKAQAEQYSKDFEANVMVKDDKIQSIKGWNLYPELDKDITGFNTVANANREKTYTTIRSSFTKLVAGIPSYLRIDDVQDAIRDVEKEMNEFENEWKNPAIKEKEHAENIEEIQEAWDDLKKEIMQARKKYVDNREDAIEEYLEEINDYDKNKSTQERINDAREEYNEEMKDN